MCGKAPVSPPVLLTAAVRLPARAAFCRFAKATTILCSALRVAWEGFAAPVRGALAPFARKLTPAAREVRA